MNTTRTPSSSSGTTPVAPKGLPEAIALVRARIGQTMLSDDDLVVLCCEQIVRSFTRDEKGYA